MMSTQGYVAMTAKTALQPFSFERREVDFMMCSSRSPTAASATLIFIKHATNGEDRFSHGAGPCVGTVTRIGSAVKKFTISDRLGVGCFVASCRTCAAVERGSEQYCEAGMLLTYSGRDKDGQPTQIVIGEHYVLRIPSALSPAGAAPLLCAGIPRTPHFVIGGSVNITNS